MTETVTIPAKRYRRYKRLRALIEEWTRCEIVARLGPVGFSIWGDCYFKKIETENEIRRLAFGTSDLVELGKLWNLLPAIEEKKDARTTTKNTRTQRPVHQGAESHKRPKRRRPV